jgi:hypothetical protein
MCERRERGSGSGWRGGFFRDNPERLLKGIKGIQERFRVNERQPEGVGRWKLSRSPTLTLCLNSRQFVYFPGRFPPVFDREVGWQFAFQPNPYFGFPLTIGSPFSFVIWLSKSLKRGFE